MANPFFIRRSGKVTGPVSYKAVKKGIGNGKLRETDEISTAAAGPWMPIGDIPQLKEFIPAPEYTYDDDVYDDDVYEPPPAPVSRRRSPDRNRRQSTPNANRTVIVFLVSGLFLGVVVVGIVVYQWQQPSVWLADSHAETRAQQLSNPNTQGGDADTVQQTPAAKEPTVDATSVKAQLEKLGATIKVNEQGEIDHVGLFGTPITDAGLVHLKGLTSLQDLNLSGTKITDVGLAHLAGLTSLRPLRLHNTQITDAGAAKLRKALPDCRIEWTSGKR